MSARRYPEILLVEDNPGDVRLTREAFKDAGSPSRLTWVSSTEEAWAFLRGEGAHAGSVRPDLVLLDLKLPRRDGRDFLAELRGDPAFSGLPVVVLSSCVSEEDVVRVSGLRASAFLRKPVDLDAYIRLARSISQYCERLSLGGAAEPTVFRPGT